MCIMFEKCFCIFSLFDNVQSILKMFYKLGKIRKNETPGKFRHDDLPAYFAKSDWF